MFADRFRAVVESAGDPAAVDDLYAADALLDSNVPAWRFQRKGVDEIATQFADWYATGAGRITALREWETGWGSVLECEERGTHEGQPAVFRTIHVLFAENGKVVKHVNYCTGPWDAKTEARHKVEAPMFEP